MKHFIAAMAAFAALPLFAQVTTSKVAPVAPGTDQTRPVAVVNGETITVEKLDLLYKRLSTQASAQYEASGGKVAYLENYLRKRLVVQEAIKHGLDQRPEVKADMQAAAESVLFDRYVRDVVSQPILTEAELRKYYDEHQSEFTIAEKVKVRHIIVPITEVGASPRTKGQAMEKITAVASELHGQNVFPAGTDPVTVERLQLKHFTDAAKKYSEDAAAENGGDLGWVGRGMLDSKFEEAAFSMKKGVVSGIVETKFGLHLIFVEDRKPAGTETFEEAKDQLREYLMTEKRDKVLESVARLTNELRVTSKVAVFPENIK
jgi:peptidyl-prolyl cis-trans isomerase C